MMQTATRTHTRKKRGNGEATFVLESPRPGEVPAAVITELEGLCSAASESASDYSEAIKVQAEKYRLKKSALRRYIKARLDDKVDEVSGEARQIIGLSERT